MFDLHKVILISINTVYQAKKLAYVIFITIYRLKVPHTHIRTLLFEDNML